MAEADQLRVRPDDEATVLLEEAPDPFAVVLPSYTTPQAFIARVIQRDGAAVGVSFDDAVAAELADAVFDALRDDEEAALDLASFAFDADVRHALAA